ncbi:2Fe-2S iron-sulfur cluster-binding protein [Paenibacillus sp. TRM 82003]|nr:2Fe-2S iron-sulfur cluster-binding protein [Paenibacillus sp. TRM 82003]
MPVVRFEPEGLTADVRQGTTILAASRQAGVSIRTRCGGVTGCLMCKVKVKDEGAVSPVVDAERRKMGNAAADGTRLSCQTKVLKDVVVEVPEDPLKAAVRRQLERQKEDEGLW